MVGPKVKTQVTGTWQASRMLRDLGLALKNQDGSLSVGINPNRRYYAGRKKPISIARVAAFNEYGVPGGKGWKVPPRPAVGTALAKNESKYRRSMQTRIGIEASKTAKKKRSPRAHKAAMRRSMMALGKMVADDIRRSILGWAKPRNADETIRKKGFDDPLVETRKLASAFEPTWTPSVGMGNPLGPLAKAVKALGGKK